MNPSKVAIVLTGIATLFACTRPDASTSGHSTEHAITDSTGAQRQWLDPGLELTATVGGSAEDTTLLNPYRLAAGEDAIYVFDGNQRLLSFAIDGSLRWVRGRAGSGPGEFRLVRALKAREGLIYVLDPRNARLTVFDDAGQMIRTTPMRTGHSEELAVLPDGDVVLFPAQSESDFVVIDDSGHTIRSGRIPWPPYQELDFLAKQSVVAQPADSSGLWALGFRLGNGWFTFDARAEPVDSTRHYYVEPTNFPEVIRERNGNSFSTHIPRTPASARSMIVQRDTLFVLVEAGDSAGRKIDLYRMSTGAYLGSFLLPHKAIEIAANGAVFAWLENDPMPALRIARRGTLERN